MSRAIGIDIGTISSCVALFRKRRIAIITNNLGNGRTPSGAAFTDDERLVDDAAMDQAAMNLTNTVFGVKRMIGRKFSDPILQNDMPHWPFKTVRGDSERKEKGERTGFCAEEISAMVLSKMKTIAEQ
jgi:L1 cell adhesion molecule like protein